MATELTVVALDEGLIAITAAFTDEDGTAVAPDTMTWTLTDGDGTTVNSRDAVAIATPSSSETVVLSGDDLKASDGGERYFVMEGTYSGNLGDGLPLKGACHFFVEDLYGV